MLPASTRRSGYSGRRNSCFPGSAHQEAFVARALVDVRRATVDDLADLLELWTEGRDENARLGRTSTPADQVGPRLIEAMATGQIEVLLARRDGRAVGFLILRVSPLSFLVDQPA